MLILSNIPSMELCGMECNFSEKGQKRAKKMLKNDKKGKMLKFGQNCTKFENILKKGRLFCVIIPHNKLLEKALVASSYLINRSIKFDYSM